MTINELIERLKGADATVRGDAWQQAGPLGAAAVKPLADLMPSADMEIARAAKRALWKIVRYSARPSGTAKGRGAANFADAAARSAVAAELVPLLSAGAADIRREFVWMLSEIGDAAAIPALVPLLSIPELREDARAALQRIPGKESLAALRAALKTVPDSYKPAIAVSLRVRGDTIRGYPAPKLLPTKPTTVKRPSIL